MTRQARHVVASAFRAAALATVALLCACGTPAPLGKVIAFDVDPGTDTVVGASIEIPARFVLNDPPAFYMKTNHGETSAWKVNGVTASGETATVDLVPANFGTPPGINAGVVVYFKDRSNALQVLPPAVTVAPVIPTAISNPDFARWAPGMPSPDDWPVTASSSETSFDIVRYAGPNKGIRISVATRPVQHPGALSTPAPGHVAAATLSQTVALQGHEIYAAIRPFQKCIVDQGRVTVASGVEISNGSKPLALFCVGSPFATRAQLDGSSVFVKAVSGKIGAWNHVRFDVGPFVKRHKDVRVGVTTQVDTTRSPYDWVTLDVASVSNEK